MHYASYKWLYIYLSIGNDDYDSFNYLQGLV